MSRGSSAAKCSSAISYLCPSVAESCWFVGGFCCPESSRYRAAKQRPAPAAPFITYIWNRTAITHTLRSFMRQIASCDPGGHSYVWRTHRFLWFAIWQNLLWCSNPVWCEYTRFIYRLLEVSNWIDVRCITTCGAGTRAVTLSDLMREGNLNVKVRGSQWCFFFRSVFKSRNFLQSYSNYTPIIQCDGLPNAFITLLCLQQIFFVLFCFVNTELITILNKPNWIDYALETDYAERFMKVLFFFTRVIPSILRPDHIQSELQSKHERACKHVTEEDQRGGLPTFLKVVLGLSIISYIKKAVLVSSEQMSVISDMTITLLLTITVFFN